MASRKSLFCSLVVIVSLLFSGCYSAPIFKRPKFVRFEQTERKKAVSWGYRRTLRAFRSKKSLTVLGTQQSWCRDKQAGLIVYKKVGTAEKSTPHAFFLSMGAVGIALGVTFLALQIEGFEIVNGLTMATGSSFLLTGFILLLLPRERIVTQYGKTKGVKWIGSRGPCGDKKAARDAPIEIRISSKTKSFTVKARLDNQGKHIVSKRLLNSIAYWSTLCGEELALTIRYATPPSRIDIQQYEKRRKIQKISQGTDKGHRHPWGFQRASIKYSVPLWQKQLVEQGTYTPRSSSPALRFGRACLAERQRKIAKAKQAKEAKIAKKYPLIMAVRKNDVDNVKKLIKRKEPMTRRMSGMTALMYASQAGQKGLVQILLQAGAGVDQLSTGGMTALMYASKHGHLEVVKLLVQEGANTTIKSKDGNTARSFAIKKGHGQIVDFLKKSAALKKFFRSSGKSKSENTFTID